MHACIPSRNIPHRDDGSSKLNWLAATKFSLTEAIRHSLERGITLDSSWRNKNENAAPMTNYLTVNSANHYVPGTLTWSLQSFRCSYVLHLLVAAALSEDVQGLTLATQLHCLKEQVERLAAAISSLFFLLFDLSSCFRLATDLSPTDRWTGRPAGIPLFKEEAKAHLQECRENCSRWVDPSTGDD